MEVFLNDLVNEDFLDWKNFDNNVFENVKQ